MKDQGIYDLFVQTHAQLTNKDYAHGTSGFLPWHRKYLLEYENPPRVADGVEGSKYKCVSVPYWDWAEDTDLCSTDGDDCPEYQSKSTILQDFGGPGSAECATNPHSRTISSASGSAKTYEWTLPDGATKVTKVLADCTGFSTWGSTGAGAWDETNIPANAVGVCEDCPLCRVDLPRVWV